MFALKGKRGTGKLRTGWRDQFDFWILELAL